MAPVLRATAAPLRVSPQRPQIVATQRRLDREPNAPRPALHHRRGHPAAAMAVIRMQFPVTRWSRVREHAVAHAAARWVRCCRYLLRARWRRSCARPPRAFVEDHERHVSPQPALQIVATGKLDRVGRTQRVCVQQGACARRHRRHDFDDQERSEVTFQCSKPHVARPDIAVAGTRAARKRRRDLHFRQPADGRGTGHQPSLDGIAPGFAHVPLRQGAGIEEPDQNRSSRSSMMVSERGRPFMTTGSCIRDRGLPVPVTTPAARS